MIKLYFKQALAQLRQQPIISLVSILGTALAIFLIMLVVMIQQVKVAPFSPESNRDRFLHVRFMSITNKEWGGGSSNGPMSVQTAKACFKSLTTPEAVTIYCVAAITTPASMPGTPAISIDMQQTDDTYWQVFDFAFVDGKPYDQAAFESGRPVAVVTESVARNLFGTTKAAGREFLLNHAPYTVAGVVKDVSVTAKDAYAQVWGMYSADELKITGVHSYLGGMQIAVLARTSDDFPAIREGIAKQVERVNAGLGNKQIDIMEQPDNIVAHVNHVWANVGPDLTMLYLQYAVALFIILLVPSLNLCGLSNSRMQQRITELGVRKAFGGTKSVLVRQILNENLMLTLLGGVVGLLFSYLAVYAMRMWLFTNNQNVGTSGEFSLNMEALFSPWVFLLAFVFCVVINLLSAALPAWIAARHTIVDSLNDK